MHPRHHTRRKKGEYCSRYMRPETVLFTYGESSTTITYGLPRQKQQELLAKHRTRAKARSNQERPLPNMSDYDLCCEYYREVYTMQTATSAALYVEASDYYSSDSESNTSVSLMPPLEPPVPASQYIGERAERYASTGTLLDTAADAADDGIGPPASQHIEKGERYANMDTLLFAVNGYVPIAEIPENLRFSPTSIPRELNVHTDAESLKRVWSLLNEVNRPQFPEMRRARHRDMFEDYEPPSHPLKIFTRTGVRHVKCRCTDGKHTSFERRQAYAFPDGQGNIVVKKSKSLLLALP
ncbi:hypothetical protein B0H16DRAFT_1731744 [Mycena metata]|uniref:Uncharacterized protein n=1 Tax=Mycena metata TaxID=1033252 RepID=A0AAD7I5K1_9AGAR|nr:hypothetical protein B0H16DRAFT_1731744 [Mycena metata]